MVTYIGGKPVKDPKTFLSVIHQFDIKVLTEKNEYQEKLFYSGNFTQEKNSFLKVLINAFTFIQEIVIFICLPARVFSSRFRPEHYTQAELSPTFSTKSLGQQTCVTHLLSHLAHTLHTGAVQVAVVLARLDKSMALDVLFHLLPRRHKVIVPPVNLILPLGSCGVCQTNTKNAKIEM